MKFSEFVNDIGIEVELIPQGKKNRPAGKNSREKVTIHNTDNPRKGANATAHSNFVRNTGHYLHKGKKNWISWHYTVDDVRVIQHVPDEETAWHSGPDGNSRSVAIEICMHEGINHSKATDNAARLAAYLLYKHDLSAGDLVPHKHWTGKNCPSRILAKGGWDKFRDQVDRYLAGLSGSARVSGATKSAGKANDGFVFEVSDHVEGVEE